MNYLLILDMAFNHMATFACRPNSKLPATQNGFKDAERGQPISDFLEVGCNYGVACEMSGLVVLDQDVDEGKGFNGIETIKSFEETYGSLPKTFTVRTPRGGLHQYFRAKGLINPIGKLGKDVDIKYRGYVLGAGSQIDGKAYEVIDGIKDNEDLEFAELPQNWIDLLNKNTANKPVIKGQKTNLTIENVDFQKILSNCAFINHCYENAEVLSEPEWFSMISILAQIKGGEELIHELSAPYPMYSFEETQKKIENARKFGCPQSCAYLSNTYSEICGNCTSANNNRKEI